MLITLIPKPNYSRLNTLNYSLSEASRCSARYDRTRSPSVRRQYRRLPLRGWVRSACVETVQEVSVGAAPGNLDAVERTREERSEQPEVTELAWARQPFFPSRSFFSFPAFSSMTFGNAFLGDIGVGGIHPTSGVIGLTRTSELPLIEDARELGLPFERELGRLDELDGLDPAQVLSGFEPALDGFALALEDLALGSNNFGFDLTMPNLDALGLPGSVIVLRVGVSDFVGPSGLLDAIGRAEVWQIWRAEVSLP